MMVSIFLCVYFPSLCLFQWNVSSCPFPIFFKIKKIIEVTLVHNIVCLACTTFYFSVYGSMLTPPKSHFYHHAVDPFCPPSAPSLLVTTTLFSVSIYLFIVSFVLFLLQHMTWGVLVPWPSIKPMPSAVEAQILNHWITREVHVH